MSTGFPKKVRIVDVGPRDGFQNVKTFIDTKDKLVIIGKLYDAGIRAIEATSFVSPKAIPQMKDSSEVAKSVISAYPDLDIIALVPNLRGAQNAWDAGIRHVSCVISASEAHNQANVRRTVDESVDGLRQIVETFPDMKIQLDVATAFGCPFSGKTPEEDVISLIDKAVCLGVRNVTLCDTIGVANPYQSARLIARCRDNFPDIFFGVHFHNTRGMALANMVAAAQNGIDIFESCVGGLGGCPFAPGSEGNAATEDTVHMFTEMGIETGVDMTKMLDAVAYVAEHVDAPVTGKMLKVTTSSCMNVSGKAE